MSHISYLKNEMTNSAESVTFLDRYHSFRTEPSAVSFTYSTPQDSRLRRIVIRGIERWTGQPKLERLYRAWSNSTRRDENIFHASLRLMDVGIECNEAALLAAPRHGPLLIVANHPFGVVDGLALMALATKLRPDVKILVHSLLCQPPETRDYLLPVDFSGTHKARQTSAATRRLAEDWLRDGHCVVIFPAGGVATAQNPFSGTATDLPWHGFIARLTRVAGLRILPIFFHGQNSRLFQLASHASLTLRLAMIFRESARRMGGSIAATVGEAIDASCLPHTEGKSAVMQALRRVTYALGGRDGNDEYHWPKYVKVD